MPFALGIAGYELSHVAITRSAARENKEQHIRAQRLRDRKIEGTLFLGLKDRRVYRLGFFISFLSDKIHLERAYCRIAVDEGGRGRFNNNVGQWKVVWS